MEHRHFTVLLAEDDANDALLIKRALVKGGIENQLQVVCDGEEAIAYLSGIGKYADRTEFPVPQFFITDLKMPRKSGFDVLAWMRQHPEAQVVPTIVLSSSKQHDDIKNAYQLGAHSFLVKPADFSQLQELARKVFDYWKTCERPASSDSH